MAAVSPSAIASASPLSFAYGEESALRVANRALAEALAAALLKPEEVAAFTKASGSEGGRARERPLSPSARRSEEAAESAAPKSFRGESREQQHRAHLQTRAEETPLSASGSPQLKRVPLAPFSGNGVRLAVCEAGSSLSQMTHEETSRPPSLASRVYRQPLSRAVAVASKEWLREFSHVHAEGTICTCCCESCRASAQTPDEERRSIDTNAESSEAEERLAVPSVGRSS